LTYLTRYPTKLQTLANEIRNAFHALEDIKSSPQLYSCIYLRACINEGLRIAPVIGGALPREVLKGGITIDGEYFPEGTILGTGSYAINHNEYYFSRPFAYEPERWLVEYQGESTGRTVEEIDRAQSAFRPFGVGPWNCAGKHMALAEASLIIARVVWLFDMETPSLIPEKGLNGKQRQWDYLKIMHNRGEIPSEDKFVAKYEKLYIKFSTRVV
jgi:cytochrome P450